MLLKAEPVNEKEVGRKRLKANETMLK